MWNENTISSHLTEQQRSRISQNYRAAKALLARKRPPCTGSSISPPTIKQKPRFPVESVRTPLAEISSNSCSNVADITSCLKTPACVVPFPNTFEEEEYFNESILLEIDAICEKSNPKLQHATVSPPSSPTLSYQSTPTREFNLSRSLFKDEEADSKSNSFSAKCREYWDRLNDKQREAACSDIATPLVITAGPGSGKTSTMVGRVLMLLNDGIPASKVLAMTFTSAAASEMRDRIAKEAGKEASKELSISTFHSFSLNLCRKHAEKFGRTSEFSIFGHTHQRRAIIEAIRLTETDEPNQIERFKDKSKKWQTFVAKAKASGLSHEDYEDSDSDTGVAILKRYNDILKSCDAMDYHDFIIFSVKLLSEYPDVLNECHVAWNAVVVDEFQDTSSMQYKLLRLLASHNRITVVGDDNQSIFSFNGADVSGFESFRRDFPNHKEVRLSRNYRSTRYIVEGSASLIRHNFGRLKTNDCFTENDEGAKIVVKECQHEQAQCAFVIDKTIEFAFQESSKKPDYSKCAILYRRQASGKIFQSAFRERRIPFNSHGVAFYRKKIIKAIIALLKTALPLCDDVSYRQSFKALLPFDKEEKKKVIEYVDKVSASRKRGFLDTATDIFEAKVSGTFKKRQITQGKKVLQTLDMISKLVAREESLSAVVTTVSNMIPQKYLLEKRAVVDVDGGKYLNEDNDPRSVLQHLLDDVSNFLSNKKETVNDKGCVKLLKSFVDYTTERERENFAVRKRENENSVTLTTIHQSKGLEWDVVFVVKANETEIPLLHEFHGFTREDAPSIEEERRLLYVAMTRARKRLFILYVSMDSNWQILQPSRFLKEIQDSVRENQAEVCHKKLELKAGEMNEEKINTDDIVENDIVHGTYGDAFLKRFPVEERSVVSQVFRRWAKKQAFQNPERLLLKVKCVIDERMSATKEKHKAVLRDLKAVLTTSEALQYAKHVLQLEKIPVDQRVLMTREKQEHFQKLRIESSMSCSAPTDKQIGYLQKLGCTTTPVSRLHASKLIEQYKAL